MIRELIKIANELDKKRLTAEADYLDCLITKIAIEEDQFRWTPEMKEKWRQMMDNDERMAQHADRQRQRAKESSSENVDALDYFSQLVGSNPLSQLSEQYSFASWHLNDFITGLVNIANKSTTPWQDMTANSDTDLYEDDPDKFIDEVVLYLTNFSSEFFLSRLGYGTEQNVLEPIDWTEFDRSGAQRYLTIHPDADPSRYGEPGNFGPHPGRSPEYDGVFPQLANELSSFILELFEIDMSNPSHEEDLYSLLIGEGDQPNIFRIKSLVDRLAQITKPFDSEEVWDGGHYRGIRYFN